MKRTLYVAAVLCLVVIVCQLITFFSRQDWGFSHEVWRTDATTGHHSNHGAVMTRGFLLVFFESEQHPIPPDGNRWWWGDKNRFGTAGSPPQFTVANTTTVRDWRIFMTGYEYSTRTLDWQGQYHLVSVHPIVLWFLCVGVILVATRRAAISLRTRNRERSMRCVECGYDLRSGHERCPECGRVVALDAAVRTEASE
jgi:hypothetical protein